MGRLARGTVIAGTCSMGAILAWGNAGLVWANLIVLGWALWLADAMNADVARARRRTDAIARRIEDRPLPEAARDFLDKVDQKLELPNSERIEIRAELSDHLADSIAAIQGEERSEEEATREALARLGSPDDLARQLTRAHQTTRRLLAGAAGGVFQAGFGVLWGTLLGSLVVMLVLIAGALLATTVLWRPVAFAGSFLPTLTNGPIDTSTGTALSAVVFCFPAFVAARTGLRTYARLSARPAALARRVWAAAGVLVIAGSLLFVVDLTQSWLSVMAEVLVPLAFAAGALWRIDRDLTPAVPRLVANVATVGLLALPIVGFMLLVSAGGGSSVAPMASKIDLLRWDGVAPAAGDATGSAFRSVGGGSMPVSVIDQGYEVLDARALDAYHDLHFELWRGVPAAGIPEDYLEFDPNPAETAPYLSLPAVLVDGELHVRIDLSHVRETRWLLFLVGVGADGQRYRLEPIPSSYVTSFSGTVWDWLAARE